LIFSNKPTFCTICKKELKHKHKPKKEWQIKGPLCADCHMDKMKEFYEAGQKQKCVSCGIQKQISDLWEPRWQWDMNGLLCKNCFDKKETVFNKEKDFCTLCGEKLRFFRYNPKSNWNMTGQLCKNCWDSQKTQNG